MKAEAQAEERRRKLASTAVGCTYLWQCGVAKEGSGAEPEPEPLTTSASKMQPTVSFLEKYYISACCSRNRHLCFA